MPNDPKRTMMGWSPHNEDLTQPQATPPVTPPPQQAQPMAFAKTMFAENTTPVAQPMAPYSPPVAYGSTPPPFAQQEAYTAAQAEYAQREAASRAAYDYQQPSYPAAQPAYGGDPYGYGAAQPAYGSSQQGYGAPPQGYGASQPSYDQQQPYYAPPQNQVRVDLVAQPPVQQPPAQDQAPLREQANATSGVSERLRFIRLTYLHLLLAILAFAGLEYLLMTQPFLVEKVSVPFVRFALGGRWNWGVVLAVFMAVSWVADQWASHAKSKAMQYAGLGFYVIAEAVIFVPLLAIVAFKTQVILARGGSDPNIIRDSAYVTLAIFGALTASVFISKKDFSFMRSGLMMASGAAMMLIVLSLVFGFNLGLVFSIGMVLLAAGYILFQTSQVLAHYDPRNHVAASLALFSSVALMFWYVIRIFMRARE